MDNKQACTLEEWQKSYKLFSDSLLPFVCTKDYPVGENSELHQAMLGKVPSKLADIREKDGKLNRYVYGFSGWVGRKTKLEEVKAWALEPLYGIGISGRYVFAIDIDIDSKDFAAAVLRTCRNFVCKITDIPFVMRVREGVGRCVLLFRLAQEDFIEGEQFKKTIITTQEGKIEFLFQRCFIALLGTHISSGSRYEIEGGLPDSLEGFPALTKNQIQELMVLLYERYSISDGKHIPSLTEENIADRQSEFKTQGDPVFEFLQNTPYFKSVSNNGSVNVHCPWEHEHSQGDSETTVKYYPPNGEDGRRGFKCLHASHTNSKTYHDFELAIGYTESLFPIAPIETTPISKESFVTGNELKESRSQLHYADLIQIAGSYDKTSAGFIKPTKYNCELLFDNPERCGFIPRFDVFKSQVYLEIGNSRKLLDQDTVSELYRICIRQGFATNLTTSMVEESIISVARLKKNRVDSVLELLESIKWDGEPRVDNFLAKVFRLENSAYLRGVGRYLMTALAGRQLSPGVKADMIPVLLGKEGVRKSGFVKALSILGDEGYSGLHLGQSNADISRLCDGLVVAEIPDLQGLSKRESGELLAWVTTQVDSYIPKYKELKVEKPRRTIIVATANSKHFLNDNTGRRRFLPIDLYHLVRNKNYIDTDYISNNVYQLWAEGAELFRLHGVLYKDAELEVLNEYDNFTVEDPLITVLKEVLLANDKGVLEKEISFKRTAALVYGMPVTQLRPVHIAKLQEALLVCDYAKDRLKKDTYFYIGDDQ